VSDHALLPRLLRILSVDLDAAGIRLDLAHDRLEKRGLAGAVHAHQPADHAPPQLHGGVVKRLNRAVVDGGVLDVDGPWILHLTAHGFSPFNARAMVRVSWVIRSR